MWGVAERSVLWGLLADCCKCDPDGWDWACLGQRLEIEQEAELVDLLERVNPIALMAIAISSANISLASVLKSMRERDGFARIVRDMAMLSEREALAHIAPVPSVAPGAPARRSLSL